MDKETLKKILRDELIENKSINDYDSDDPFVGIYLDDLVDLRCYHRSIIVFDMTGRKEFVIDLKYFKENFKTYYV